jgi:hypothetical protein
MYTESVPSYASYLQGYDLLGVQQALRMMRGTVKPFLLIVSW